jgi:hypothetical protein
VLSQNNFKGRIVLPEGDFRLFLYGRESGFANRIYENTLDDSQAKIIKIAKGISANIEIPFVQGDSLDLRGFPKPNDSMALAFFGLGLDGAGRVQSREFTLSDPGNAAFLQGFLPGGSYNMALLWKGSFIQPGKENQSMVLQDDCSFRPSWSGAKKVQPPVSGGGWKWRDICPDITYPQSIGKQTVSKSPYFYFEASHYGKISLFPVYFPESLNAEVFSSDGKHLITLHRLTGSEPFVWNYERYGHSNQNYLKISGRGKTLSAGFYTP